MEMGELKGLLETESLKDALEVMDEETEALKDALAT